MDILSRRIHDLRVDSDMKQSTMAEAIGISQTMVSNYENGREPPLEVIFSYAEYFNVSVEYLLGLTADRKKQTTQLDADMAALAASAERAGHTPLVSCDFQEIVTAFRAYYAAGAQAGSAPMDCTRSFLSAMVRVLDAATKKDVPSLLLASNDVAGTALNVSAVLAAVLGVETKSDIKEKEISEGETTKHRE